MTKDEQSAMWARAYILRQRGFDVRRAIAACWQAADHRRAPLPGPIVLLAGLQCMGDFMQNRVFDLGYVIQFGEDFGECDEFA